MASHVALIVSGGIAVYKAVELIRLLQKAGHVVRVCMTEAATRFVGPLTFEALSGNPVLLDLFESDKNAGSAIAHIDLADWADVCVVAPASANIMAKMAAGIADDAASTTLLAMHCPVLVAPAMNTHMLENPATQQNIALLESRGVHFVKSATGLLACGYTGEGKLAAVETIFEQTLSLMGGANYEPARGKTLLIDAGPTHEAIDPVRYLANASTGKMGYTIAKTAKDMGFDQVLLVTGPTALDVPAGVLATQVTTADEMHKAMLSLQDKADVVICTAAVCDYKPKLRSDHKLKKGIDELEQIELVRNPDILADLVKHRRPGQVIVGFAAETDNLLTYAEQKRVKKGADIIVANDVSRKDSTFGADTSKIYLMDSKGTQEFDTEALPQVAKNILIAALKKCN